MKSTRKNRSGLQAIVAAVTAALCLTLMAGPSAQADESTYKGLKLFSDVIEMVESSYVDPVETEELISGAIQGMVRSLDPHSEFLTPESYDDLQVSTRGEFGGVGIQISMRDGYVTVIAPIMGTPAFIAGIKAGDKIIAVNGETTQDMKLTDAVKRMRGEKGTYVTLTIYREGMKKAKDFKILRDIIPIESVHQVTMEPGFGYVRVTNFTDSTLGDLKDALKALENGDTPLSGLILDLRNNPGGLLSQAIDISDLFLEDGVIVSIKGRRRSHTKDFHARPNRIARDYPMVCLINAGSASASEIVAGALQDQKRALILGTTSFGKGSVQSVEPLRDGYALKLTIARYYTPSGRSIQAEGIVPDIIVQRGFDRSEEEEGEEDSPYFYVKEKDLRNHLDAEPGLEDDEETDADAQEETTPEPEAEEVTDPETAGDNPDPSKAYGYLEAEALLQDHQIGRSLEILKGYHLLSGSGK